MPPREEVALPRIELEIVWRSGIQDDTSQFNAYLGVSFSKTTHFSRAMMRNYMVWAGKNVRNLLVIVADHLEAHNYVVFRGLSLPEAERRTRIVGDQLKTAYSKTIPEDMRRCVSVQLASDILASPGCISLLGRVQALQDGLPEFDKDLTAAVLDAVGWKLTAIPSAGIDKMAVFPYRPQAVILNAFSGAYSHHFSDITGGIPFRAIQLVPRIIEAPDIQAVGAKAVLKSAGYAPTAHRQPKGNLINNAVGRKNS